MLYLAWLSKEWVRVQLRYHHQNTTTSLLSEYLCLLQMNKIVLSHPDIFATCEVFTRIKQMGILQEVGRGGTGTGDWNGWLSSAFEIIALGLVMLVFSQSLDSELLCLVLWCHSCGSCCHVLLLVGTQAIAVELNHYAALKRYSSETLQVKCQHMAH